MSGERWSLLRDLFSRAQELPPEERAAFLDRETGGDAALRAEVEAMLVGHDSPALQPFAFSRGTFRDLELLEEIGSGGMGVVYRARQLSLGRIVAVKVLRERPGLARSDVQRFREEARRVSRLRHPGIVSIHAVGQDDESPHFVMEHVPGYSLHDLLLEAREKRASGADPAALPDLGPSGTSYPGRVAQIVAAVADALDYAHREQVVHRDVKPSNVLLDDTGRVYLVDFGIAHDAGNETRSQSRMGTLVYMSPEQARLRAASIDHRTDVYSLGVVAYELLTLALPFEGETDEQVCRAIRDHDPLPIRKVNPIVPRDLAIVCAKAMEKEVDRRYATAADFAADLRRFLAHESPLARPPGFLRTVRQRLRPHRTLLVSVGLVLALAGTTAFTWRWRDRHHVEARVGLRAEPIDGRSADAAHAVRALAVDPGSGLALPRAEWLDLGVLPLVETALDPGTYKLWIEDGAGRSLEILTSFDAGASHELGAVRLRADDEVVARSLRVGAAGAEEPAMVRIPASAASVPAWLLQAAGSALEPESMVTIELAAFWIDRHEVTNGEYRDFVTATGHRAPAYWPADFDERRSEWMERGLDLRPVVGVTAADAEAYARWAGKRLPTPLEWVRAARGTDLARPSAGDPDPAGAEAANTRAQRGPSEANASIEPWEGYLAYVDRVGARARDVSPDGVRDLAGNVREWTALGPRQSLVDGPRAFSREQRIVAGASYSFEPRPLEELAVVPATTLGAELGFRCVRPDR